MTGTGLLFLNLDRTQSNSLPDTVYWLDYGGNCVYGNDCDSISVISTDSNLLGTTRGGLKIADNKRFGLTQDTTVTNIRMKLGVVYYWYSHVDLRVYAPINTVQISSEGNIRTTPTVTFSMDEEAWCKPHRGSNNRLNHYSEIGNYTFSRGSFTPDTNRIGNGIFIDGIYATSRDTINWVNSRNDRDRLWCWLDFDAPNKPKVTNYRSSSRVAVYDVGVPIESHMAYWSTNATESMYGIGTYTKHDPSVVVVSNDDTYMIVEKTTPNSNLVDHWGIIYNKTGGLRITDLPPNTAYQIKDNYGLVISWIN